MQYKKKIVAKQCARSVCVQSIQRGLFAEGLILASDHSRCTVCQIFAKKNEHPGKRTATVLCHYPKTVGTNAMHEFRGNEEIIKLELAAKLNYK